MFRSQPIDMEMLESLFSIQSEEVWSERIFQLATKLGFNQSLLIVRQSKLEPLENAYIRINYSLRDEISYYQQLISYLAQAVVGCFKYVSPFIWTIDSIKHNEEQKNIYEEALKYEFKFGVIFPIYGSNGECGIYALFSQQEGSKQFQNEIFQSIAQLALLKEYVFESSKKFLLTKKKVHLTPREKEIIEWTLIGKSCWEISMILYCSETTINFHMNNIRNKFNVRTKQQIMVKAVTLGLVHADW